MIGDGPSQRQCAKYRWSEGGGIPLCRNHHPKARELVREEGRAGGRATANRSARARLLAAPIGIKPIRTPNDLMLNLQRVMDGLWRGTLPPANARSILTALEHERERLVRHVDPDVVEGGSGFIRWAAAAPMQLDALCRPVDSNELALIQQGIEDDEFHGRDVPRDWRGLVRRYLVEQRSEVAYADETMKRVMGRYVYEVFDGKRPQDVQVRRVFVPIGRVGGASTDTACAGR